ncbi:plasmid mobilization protein [Clavibacter michiganensis]|uniref:plasmid mobilization protein n=1 Tax=Clavibacter michiganensis TaxID=28447 RepID=UPI003DA090EC
MAGSLRWAEGMVELVSEPRENRLFGRKRQANAPAGEKREHRHVVRLTDEQEVQIAARAAVRDVSIPRLLVEAALNEHVVISSEWKAAAADLMDLRSKLGYTANNINQLAKFANSEGQFPAQAETALAEYKALLPQIQAAVARVAAL